MSFKDKRAHVPGVLGMTGLEKYQFQGIAGNPADNCRVVLGRSRGKSYRRLPRVPCDAAVVDPKNMNEIVVVAALSVKGIHLRVCIVVASARMLNLFYISKSNEIIMCSLGMEEASFSSPFGGGRIALHPLQSPN
jgi:hypothetical protein